MQPREERSWDGHVNHVLSDVGCKVGLDYGVDFVLDTDLLPLYGSVGLDVAQIARDGYFRLPVPATYVIDTDGSVGDQSFFSCGISNPVNDKLANIPTVNTDGGAH